MHYCSLGKQELRISNAQRRPSPRSTALIALREARKQGPRCAALDRDIEAPLRRDRRVVTANREYDRA